MLFIKALLQENFAALAERFAKMGCRFIATKGTAACLKAHGIKVQTVKKISEGVPNVLDVIRSGVVDLIVDIPRKANNANSDGFKIRRTAVESSITIITAMDTVTAMCEVMEKKIDRDKLDIFDLNRDIAK